MSAKLAAAPEVPIASLGSGSDYSPFLQHLGIASLNTSFSGEGPSGSYHTLYDTYAHYTRFRDPGFRYGATSVRTQRTRHATVSPRRRSSPSSSKGWPTP
jgi:hypothetical protein